MQFARCICAVFTVCLGTQSQSCEAANALKNRMHIEGSICSDFVGEGGQVGRSCYWQFDFRAETAADFADTIWDELIACRAGVVLGADRLVNHPDSYDLRTWVTNEGSFAVSVKDKGQLNKTLVFLRYVVRKGLPVRQAP